MAEKREFLFGRCKIVPNKYGIDVPGFIPGGSKLVKVGQTSEYLFKEGDELMVFPSSNSIEPVAAFHWENGQPHSKVSRVPLHPTEFFGYFVLELPAVLRTIMNEQE